MKMRWVLMFALILLIGAVPVFARQADEETAVYLSDDGVLTFEYPADWVVEEDTPFVLLANTEEALQAYLDGEDLGREMIVALIANVAALGEATETPELSDAETPRDVIEFVAADAESDQELMEGEFDGFAYAQLIVENDDTRDAGTEASITVLDTPLGMVILIAETGDVLTDYDDAFQVVALSLLTAEPAVVTTDDGDLISQWAAEAEGSSQYGDVSWSASQATGEPDTETCGDQITAWASSGSTEKATLTLTFETEVLPQEINIYQTYNPGSIISVSVITVEGEMIVVDASADGLGSTECPSVLSIDASEVNALINGVLISLDQSIGGSWNEIDAVELVGLP